MIAGMEPENRVKSFFTYSLRPLPALLAIIVVFGFAYVIYTQMQIQQQIAVQQEETTIAINELNDEVILIESVLSSAQEENQYLADAFKEAQERSESLENQFERVNDNVETLEKITTTDPELLQKYSKVFFLNEHYAPEDLRTIPSKYTYNPDRTYQILSLIHI